MRFRQGMTAAFDPRRPTSPRKPAWRSGRSLRRLRAMNPVAITGLLVAALRAEESRREDRLFDDPFAEVLAGTEGRAVLERYRAAASAGTVPIIEVRTR